MEEESTQRLGTEGGSKPLPKAPAFFVILHPSQGDGSKEEGILVANRDVSSVAPFITTGSNKSKSDFFLSANCTSGEITVTLDNNNMWNEFYRCNTEMVLTKQGRRMFPYCRYWISGLNPYLKYILVMDITPLDNHRYKWNGKWWEPAGKADPHVLGRVFIHPESPSTGNYWMHQPVSFYKLKLTNNILDQDGHIILHSMHRYLPRLHVVPAEKASEVIQLNGPDVHTFTFPQTEFIAVTAYQNFQITQLKIDCNPFAKGFREGTVTGRPVKDVKHKPSEKEDDCSHSQNEVENEDPSGMEKLQDLFKMSECLEGDKENESFNYEQNFLKIAKTTSELDKNSNQNVIQRFNEHSSVGPLSEPTDQPKFEVKKEPDDHYDYSKTTTIEGIAVKQEQSDVEVTDDYSNSDVDYPILEKHFAKFKEDPYLEGKHSLDNPTRVAKGKLLTLDQGNLAGPDLKKYTVQDMHDSTDCTDNPLINPSPSVNTHFGNDVSVKEKRKRICKNKIDEIYMTLQTALRTSRGPKRKFPSLLPKPPVTSIPGNEGTVAPIAKKRGRPPKPKISKVGRPAKKDNPIEAPRLFPDFNPDLEDVDGVLFVAFSSKEALDVHTGKKPTDTVPSSLSTEASIGLTDEMQKILGLEGQLLTHLKTMKYRQVIHPALQQVGLKLNIVDPAMSIDLRYLGVELPLPYITSEIKYDDNGLCAQVSGLPFVSRTGKTTDITKIKGWRDKFSSESATISPKIEARRPESTLKNLSAFCSDELDEYLEKEAKLMGDLKELTRNEPESSITYQLPTKSSSYVRTLDSVLKKQAQQAMSTLNATEALPAPRQKRKYTRRAPHLKANSKPKPILPAPVTIKEEFTKPYSPIKDHSSSNFLNKVTSTPSSSVEYLSKSQPMVKPSRGEQSGTVQHNLATSVEDSVLRSFQQGQIQSQHIVSKPIGFSKAQMKLMELEECAVWAGKPRTYITEERADVSLSTLLTAQASLKNRPIQKLINKRTNSCNNEFCRLGCICSSLSSTKHMATHCRHETCMFSGDCLKNKLYNGKDGYEVKMSRTTQDEAESDFSPIPGYGYKPEHAENTVESLEVKQTEEHQEMSVDCLHDRSMKSKKRKCYEGKDRISDVRTPIRFPIWNRSDIADDTEPLCIPEQAEFVEPIIVHKGHVEKSKSPGGGKPGRPSTVVQAHPEDPVYLYFDSMMTCARVRTYARKAPEEKKMKDQIICDSETPVKEHDLNKAKDQEKEANGKEEVVYKRSKTNDNNGPTKLIEIISDCSWEEDASKVLKITSQHITSKEPQSFKLGSFNIELMQEKKSGEKSNCGTVCSHVKIAVSAEKQLNPAPPKPRPIKWKDESVKPPDEEPEDASADKKAKSHGGKGLPFYTKVTPAGKLVARMKTSDINEAELVEVNGKNYPQAKLLLGRMGALHPANRLAAYVTHRLQPSLFHLSKVKEVSAKMATKSLSSDLTTEDKAKDIQTSQQNKTGIVAANDARAMTLTSVPSTNDTVLTPPVLSPALVKSLTTTGNTSSISLSNNPGINKSIANSVTNLLVSQNIPRLGSVASQVGLNITSPMTVKTVTAPAVSALSTSGVTSGFQKRLGPRLLLIPVNSASAPARPVQCVQTSPGQKMVLQPIKNANGVTLFRHPNGQIIQLVPLQQVASASLQPTKQQVVIRNPGPVMGVRLPFPTKPEATSATSVSIPATTTPTSSAPVNVPVVSPSKTSSNKSGETVLTVPQNLPMLTQFGVPAVKASPPTNNCEASLLFPQVVTYTGSGHAVIASNVMPQKSGALSLANVPPPTLQYDSPVNAAKKPNLTLMGNKPGTVSDPNKQDTNLLDSSLSPLPSSASGDKNDKKEVKECEWQPTSEIVKDENEVEVQGSTNEKIKCVTQEASTLAKEEEFQNGQQDNEQSQHSIDSIDEYLASDAEMLQETEEKGAQSPTDIKIKSQVEIGDGSPVTAHVPVDVEQNILYKTGEKAELMMEQSTAKAQISSSPSDQNDSISPRVDPQTSYIRQPIFDNLDTEDESEVEESVDIETVEELSEKRNLARLKASATTINNCGIQGKSSKGRKKGSKVNGEDGFSVVGDEDSNVFQRQNHTANERKRRSELRDLFEELKNALGLHNLPKVSKSYILKQAIEEIEDLTDTADTLIKKKTLLSQTQTQLIKKVSNLSGKPKEVVQKKLEYLYAKQKALEAEKKKKNLEQDVALHRASMNITPPKKDYLLPMKAEEDSNETLSSKTKKPIILARKHLLLSKEEKHQQPGVSLTTSNVLMAPIGQVLTQQHKAAGQIAGIPPTLIQADLSPAQLKSGMTSVVIQLPSTIELKGIIGNSPIPISLSAVPANISTATPSGPMSEIDDLSMMPKIVNVTSLAQGTKSDLGRELGIGTPSTKKECKTGAHSLGTESYVGGSASVQDASYVTAELCVPSTSIPMDKTEESHSDPARKSFSPYSSLLENLPQENDGSNIEASLKSKNVSTSNAPLAKMVDDIRDSGLELELKKLTSAIDEAGLEPSELSDTVNDAEDTDETLTSLLNEIEFLNQQLNNDTDDLDSISDFPGSDTASRSSVSKFAEGESSPFSFGRFKEVPETKEKNISFSSLFMQLEEGEIPDSIKHSEDADILVFEGGARKEPPLTNVVGTQSGLYQPPATGSTHQKTDKPVTSCSNAFWRPMPKLAPLGLKSHTIPDDQRVLANKSMPSLASVAMRLSSPKNTD